MSYCHRAIGFLFYFWGRGGRDYLDTAPYSVGVRRVPYRTAPAQKGFYDFFHVPTRMVLFPKQIYIMILWLC
jgi:hypothetical protein